MLSRRSFLRWGAASGTSILGSTLVHATEPSSIGSEPLGFFVIGDTHYCADPEDSTRLRASSLQYNRGLLETINLLPGKTIPEDAGGGRVIPPAHVIHLGDIIDNGDKTAPDARAMQQTEWKCWETDYGLEGTEGILRFPIRELHGNHDSPRGEGAVIEGMMSRNRRRKNLAGLCKKGLHYSWDAGGVHFINLGITVGEDASIPRRRRYHALGSLDFLIADLAENVGASGRPVILSHHIDIARYAETVDAATAQKNEWDFADVHAFRNALKGYRIAGIFYGHTHRRSLWSWKSERPAPWGSPGADTGIPVFNNGQSAHFGSEAHAFLYCEIAKGELLVRECITTDGWKTHQWTPQLWRAPHRVA
ncbi:MAG: hypothetical protein RLZZ142_374 [Verrucomicrobiota bacterium]|jgi:hypothetical protein